MRPFLRGDDGGQAVVEFALALPILLVVLLGLATLGLVLNAKQQLEGVARQGARVYAATAELDRSLDALRISGRQLDRFPERTTVSYSIQEQRQQVIRQQTPRQVCSGGGFSFRQPRRCTTVYDVTTRTQQAEASVLSLSGQLSSVRATPGQDRDVKAGQWVTVVATYSFANPLRVGIGTFRLPAAFPITTRAVARMEKGPGQ